MVPTGRGARQASNFIQALFNIPHPALLAEAHKEYGDYDETNYDEWDEDQQNNAGIEYYG